MLEVTRPQGAGAAQIAQMRIAYSRHGLDSATADMVMAATDADTAKEIAPTIKKWLADFSRRHNSYMNDIDAATAKARDDLASILSDPDTTPDNLEAQAIAYLPNVVDMVFDAKRAAAGDDLPRMGAHVRRSYDEGPGLRARMIAGLTRRLDPAADTTGAPALSLGDIAMTLARRAGHQPFNEAEAIRMAAHSTSDFPLILDGSMSNLVARRIETLAPAIQRAAHVVQRDDCRQGRSLHLSATAMPAEIKEGGEIKFVTADEKGELLPKLRDFGSGFNITNQALVNDTTATGLLNDMANRMAEGAVGRFRAVLLEPLLANSGTGQTMADGNPLFHASHGNLAASGAAPDVTTLSNARTAMRRQTGLKGELLALEPWALIVPPELETAAEKLLADLAAAEVAEVNPFAGKLKLIVEPGLTDDGAWYLCADPSRFDGLAYAFLDGQSRPRVESRPAWSTLGMELRLAWALDAKFVATATWYRNPGA